MNRIERIEAYEKLFDEVRSAVDAAREALNALEELRPAAERLREYYTGRQWKRILPTTKPASCRKDSNAAC